MWNFFVLYSTAYTHTDIGSSSSTQAGYNTGTTRVVKSEMFAPVYGEKNANRSTTSSNSRAIISDTTMLSFILNVAGA